ncbi:MAG TPA: hypothetical protein VF131_16625 [Blastocatellia bacterium]|nr:hypothetical protein [Blastocatellia bacterium]
MDKYKDKVSRIVLLPGDVEIVEKLDVFRAILSSFIDAARPEIIIGDFTTPDRYSSKELVDTYGTYSLLANWFPEVSRAVKALPLSKPRSEFLNIEVSVLDQFLDKRKFAYEQTLNMLIRSWDYENKRWRHGIRPFPLGTLQDDKSFRQYRDCLDQIERTERLLKLLWRELNEPPSTGVFEQDELRYKEFSQEYEDIARRSTDIRESARLTIRALLGA